ncbi:MAG: hypothetical protein JO291_09280 [Acidimicrobiia bacterium]|nr:hypothetical protein [Acidimicrobiia bacterium]
MLRGLRWLLFLAFGGGLALYLVKLLRGDPAPVFGDLEPLVPAPVAAPAPAPAAWLEPSAGPRPDYPVKGKTKSGIYHLPGMANYERTSPDRWYRDEAAAEADGLRPAKR